MVKQSDIDDWYTSESAEVEIKLNLKGAIKDWAEKMILMGSICGVNVNEPSEGDLKRLNSAYIKLWSECADVKADLATCVSALSKIANAERDIHVDVIAREALAAIGRSRG